MVPALHLYIMAREEGHTAIMSSVVRQR